MHSISNPVLDRPSQVYDAIVETIEAELIEANNNHIQVGGYNEWGPSESGEQQILIEFGEVKPGPDQNDGRDAYIHEIIIYSVISKGIGHAQLIACNLAVGIKRMAKSNRWGLSSEVIDEPNDFVSEPSFLIDKDENHHGFEAWEVRFSQVFKYGKSKWPEDSGMIDSPFFLAINPVDEDDESEYESVEFDAE